MTKLTMRPIPKGQLPENYSKARIWKQLCLQKELGFGDALFGGEMMSFIDKAAAMYLMEKCETKLLRTVNTQTDFIAKVNPGDIIHFYGEITKIGKHSVTMEMDIFKIDVESKDVNPVGTATTTFVRVNEDGTKKQIHHIVRRRIQKEIDQRIIHPSEIVSE